MATVTGRDIAALLNPRPVVLLSCCDASGKPNAMTAIWHTPISHEPPMLGISVGPARHSHSLIMQTGEFVLNIVGPEHQKAVIVCGNCSGATTEKSVEAGFSWRESHSVRPPRIADALGYLECRVVDRRPFGDHSFFVASVVHAEARDACFPGVWHEILGDVLLCRQRDEFGRCAPLSPP